MKTIDFQTAYKMMSQPSILTWITDKKNPNLYYLVSCNELIVKKKKPKPQTSQILRPGKIFIVNS